MQTTPSLHRLRDDKAIRFIGLDGLFRALASGRRVLVVDVREATEIEHSPLHFAGAVQIPVHQLFVRRAEIPLRNADVVVAVSNRGVRAGAAALTLSLIGAPDVRVLEGGLEAWSRRLLSTP